MLTRNLMKKSLSIIIAGVVLSLCSTATFASAEVKNSGELITAGKVTINNQLVTTNVTVVSGSVINSQENSTINLGKLGKLEISPASNLTLNFNEKNISVTLATGIIKVLSNQGITTRISTKNGVVETDGRQIHDFTVTAEDSLTKLDALSGSASLTSAKGITQFFAGAEAAFRIQPDNNNTYSSPTANSAASSGSLGISALLLAAGNSVQSAVIDGTVGGKTDVNASADTVPVSLTK